MFALFLYMFLMPGSQGLESFSRVYAQEGMLMVQLPGIACKTQPLGTKGTANVESMWAKEEKKNANGKQWRMIIVGNKDGTTTQTFKQPILGWHEMANTSQKNDDFYGRVKITTGCDLVIQNVRKEDEGLYVSGFKIMKTNGSKQGYSTVELVVLPDTCSRANNEVDGDKKATKNATGPGKNITAEDNADNTTCRNNNQTVNSDGGCLVWIILFSVALGVIIIIALRALGYFLYRRNSSPQQGGPTDARGDGTDKANQKDKETTEDHVSEDDRPALPPRRDVPPSLE